MPELTASVDKCILDHNWLVVACNPDLGVETRTPVPLATNYQACAPCAGYLTSTGSTLLLTIPLDPGEKFHCTHCGTWVRATHGPVH